MTSETLEFILSLNVHAVVELQRQAVPRMIERGRGHVVNVSSFGGVICPPNLAVYAATKAFITHLTVNLAAEFRDTPVGFTKVEIGEVADTGLMEKGRTDPVFTALVQRLYRLHLSRLITPAEITRATLAAIEGGHASVRLPRRIGASSYLVDAPRALSNLLARDLRRKQRTVVCAMTASNASAASPRTVVERYNYELWNEQNYAVGEEILGEEIVRNTPGGRVVQTRQQAIQRVRDLLVDGQERALHAAAHRRRRRTLLDRLPGGHREPRGCLRLHRLNRGLPDSRGASRRGLEPLRLRPRPVA